MDVGQGSEELVNVELDLENGHGRLHLVEEPRCSVDGLGDKLLNKVEINFVFL